MTENGKNSRHVRDLDAHLEAWNDERLVPKESIRAWYLFHEYLVNLAEEDGWQYDGHSLSVKLPMSTLVVRGTLGGIPHVVFSSGRTTTACIRAFLRKMDAGVLEWQRDKYR